MTSRFCSKVQVTIENEIGNLSKTFCSGAIRIGMTLAKILRMEGPIVNSKMKTKIQSTLVAQEHPLGCAVACVASLCEISYSQALDLFEVAEFAWTRGFYCSEVIKALSKRNLIYSFEKSEFSVNLGRLEKSGSMAFVAPNSKYPSGHFLLRVEEGWMNPWANFPQMIPVKAAIEAALPGKHSYILYSGV